MSESTATSAITPVQHLNGHWYYTTLLTTDLAAASTFYGCLFGWDVEDLEGTGGAYRQAYVDGRLKAGLTHLGEDDGASSYWHHYLTVDDIEATAARVPELGGSVDSDIAQVLHLGRMAMVTDPAGAKFSLWEDGAPDQTTVFDEHGSPLWWEGHSSDVGAAMDFYEGLVGWSRTANPMGPEMTYYTMNAPADQVDPMQEMCAGMMQQMPEDRAGGVASMWLVYFNVDDLDASYELALQLGATSVVEPHDIPEVGRFAILADPQGAHFACMKPLPRPMPDHA